MKNLTNKELSDLLEEIGVIRFDFLSENIVYYKTLLPIMKDGEYYHYAVELYIRDGMQPDIFSHIKAEKLNPIDLKLCSIYQIGMKEDKKEIYFAKYTD